MKDKYYNQNGKPSILFIVPTDYESLIKKGVAYQVLERDEGSFFNKVITVHPNASRTQSLTLNEIHQLVEFGPHYPFPFLNFKFGRVINHFLRPFFCVRK